MVSFHQTISLGRYLAIARGSCDERMLRGALERLFPHHAITLTNSGRSAFALCIEALGLEGKTLMLPAYVCNVLLPVLTHYRIQPIFLDIDPDTYQPPESAYTPAALKRADAALLIATYGRAIDPAIPALLKKHGVMIVEDFAHRQLPHHPEDIGASARYYSLPKVMPTTHGGLAIVPQKSSDVRVLPHRMTLEGAKNTVKLFKTSSALFETAKFWLKSPTPRDTSAPLSFGGIRRLSGITQRIACHYLTAGGNATWQPTPWQYCLPIRVYDPERARRLLFRHGIVSERLWYDPIVFHRVAQERFDTDPSSFPETVRAAREVVCVPLWHLTSESEYQQFRKKLEEILAGEKTR